MSTEKETEIQDSSILVIENGSYEYINYLTLWQI